MIILLHHCIPALNIYRILCIYIKISRNNPGSVDIRVKNKERKAHLRFQSTDRAIILNLRGDFWTERERRWNFSRVQRKKNREKENRAKMKCNTAQCEKPTFWSLFLSKLGQFGTFSVKKSKFQTKYPLELPKNCIPTTKNRQITVFATGYQNTR